MSVSTLIGSVAASAPVTAATTIAASTTAASTTAIVQEPPPFSALDTSGVRSTFARIAPPFVRECSFTLPFRLLQTECRMHGLTIPDYLHAASAEAVSIGAGDVAPELPYLALALVPYHASYFPGRGASFTIPEFMEIYKKMQALYFAYWLLVEFHKDHGKVVAVAFRTPDGGIHYRAVDEKIMGYLLSTPKLIGYSPNQYPNLLARLEEVGILKSEEPTKKSVGAVLGTSATLPTPVARSVISAVKETASPTPPRTPLPPAKKYVAGKPEKIVVHKPRYLGGGPMEVSVSTKPAGATRYQMTQLPPSRNR